MRVKVSSAGSPRNSPCAVPASSTRAPGRSATAATGQDQTQAQPAPVEPVVVPPEVPSDAIPAPTTEVITGTPEPVAPVERIDPATGRLDRLRGRLARSQNTVGQGLLGLLGAGDLDEESWEEIEDTLIMADLGADLTMKVTESLREKIAERGVETEEEARAMLRETLIEAARPDLAAFQLRGDPPRVMRLSRKALAVVGEPEVPHPGVGEAVGDGERRPRRRVRHRA